MRVLMLGWEFPPFISGGLGTACYGLTRALARHQTQVIFVLPKAIDLPGPSHVRLLGPRNPTGNGSAPGPGTVTSTLAYRAQSAGSTAELLGPASGDLQYRSHVSLREVPARLLSPYQSTGGTLHPGTTASGAHLSAQAPIGILSGASRTAAVGSGGSEARPFTNYQGDLIAESQRYARLCVDLAACERFDVIHAHDWLTFPAGMAVAAATGKPLIVHVHSTEFDRAGQNIHQQVYDIERRGMLSAMRVIAVSHMTRSLLVHRYGVAPEKISVVYNGIDSDDGAHLQPTERNSIRKGDKIVLFLGRITMQKGPEYFIHAARKVLDKFQNVKFVMAGSGDKIRDVIELAAQEGIGHKVLFTGFLRGPDVERVFNMADVYVMPSVSEPFGIAPLEAIRHDVPVIISKQSGVAEVLTHALKVDFWDTEEMANKIIAVLKHPPLSSTLREHADLEVRKLTWDDAAAHCLDIYQDVQEAMGAA